VSLNKAKVFAEVDKFEAVLLRLEQALDLQVEQSVILRMALDKTGSELAEYLIWEVQKKMLEKMLEDKKAQERYVEKG
jgi:hypothetical protein